MRPSRHAWAMQLARLTAQRSTCLRRSVGCVLLNERGFVLATGYNGVASGLSHCNEAGPGDLGQPPTWPHACPGAHLVSGTGLDACEAIHAEQNALLQCSDVWKIEACYTTTSPCITCTKLLLNTSCARIYFLEAYSQPEAEALWTKAGRLWTRLEL